MEAAFFSPLEAQSQAVYVVLQLRCGLEREADYPLTERWAVLWFRGKSCLLVFGPAGDIRWGAFSSSC